MAKKRVNKVIAIVLAAAISFSARAQEIPAWKLADLQTVMDTTQGPVIINFWATFCKPCIAELPYFQAAANRYKASGVKLIMVSLDVKEAYPKAIASFAGKRKLTSPVVFLDETESDRFIPAVDSTWSGAIPASLFLNKAKNYRHFVEEELSPSKLEAEIKKMLSAGE